MKQKAFVVYPSWRYYMDLLEDPELITEFAYAMFDVGEGKEPRIANSKVEVAINAIKPIIDANNAAYEERCRKNKAAARRRWSNADADAQHTDANAFHSDGDNDNENDSDNDNENEDDNENNKNCLACQAGPSDIPTETEVIQEAQIRGLDFSETLHPILLCGKERLYRRRTNTKLEKSTKGMESAHTCRPGGSVRRYD